MTCARSLYRVCQFLVFSAATFFASVVCAQFNLGGDKTIVSTDQVRAELLAHAPEGISAGRTVWVGLQLRHKPEWHTYWKNSGDSGLPTQFEWSLPPGVLAGEIAWPLPKKLPLGTLVNYGYEGTVLLAVPLTISPNFSPPPQSNKLQVGLRASWLVCRTECIPEEGEFLLNIPIQGSTALNAAAFQTAWTAQPQNLSATGSRLRINGKALELILEGLPKSLIGKSLDVFPETAEVTNPSAQSSQSWQGGIWQASLPLADQRSASPSTMALVITHEGQGWRVQLPVEGAWPANVKASGVSPALQAALDANAQTPEPAALPGSFLAALLGALLGGLLLNLMPCVFPVLAIKVLSFTQHADDHRGHRISGVAYTLGVVASFMALGLLLLGLRAAGESLGWGFQLQNPLVVTALAVLFTLIGLNLAGLYEFGQFAPTALSSFQAKHPVVDSFFTGILAVAVASPCSAPFMGASLGLAVTLPSVQAISIFAALGVGLALPYLLASFVPSFASWLPKPGAWMQVLRRLLAFPMFMTVIWMVWILGHQNGVDGVGALLTLLLILSALIWSITLSGQLRVVLASTILLIGIWALWALGPYLLELHSTAENNSSSNATSQTQPQTQNQLQGQWQAWRPGLVEQLTAQGKTVFVDFTAAWCVTCQYNKQTTLADQQLMADLKSRQVILLRADWTRRDAAITAALARLGRNGVPVYVFYKQGVAPKVLSEVLSVAEVRSALSGL